MEEDDGEKRVKLEEHLKDGKKGDDEEGNLQQSAVNRLLKAVPELDEVFEVRGKIGEGTFSAVYLATLKADKNKTKRKFAVKHIVPTCHPDRVKFELKCLLDIGGRDNVARVDLCLRHQNDIVLVMPYQKHDSFASYVGEMDSAEAALYIKNLLIAVARVHKFGIIHRDIKPSNFLYNRQDGSYLLVDFGLAQLAPQATSGAQKRKREESPEAAGLSKAPFSENNLANKNESAKRDEGGASKRFKENHPVTSIPDKKPAVQKSQICRCFGKARSCAVCMKRKALHANRAGTPGFRPPEVLLKSAKQTTAIDVWAVGVILLNILSGTGSFFSATDDMSALAELINLFGTDAIKKAASVCGRHFLCSEKRKPVDLRKLCCVLRARSAVPSKEKEIKENTCQNCLSVPCVCADGAPMSFSGDKFSPLAYDLLKELLNINPETRISAVKALEHPFVADV